MKKLVVLLSLCVLIASFPFVVVADDSIGNISTSDDPITTPSDESIPEYVENQIVLATNYYVDLTQYEGNGPFDFHGVQITDIKQLFRETTEAEIAARIEKMGICFRIV